MIAPGNHAKNIQPSDRIRHCGITVRVMFVRWFENDPQGMGYFVIEYDDPKYEGRIEHRTLTVYRDEWIFIV